MRFLKETFRYRLAGITMLTCFVLSMIVSYYGITIYKNIVMEEKEKNDYRYTSEVWFRLQPEHGLLYPKIPEKIACNLKIVNCLFYSDSEEDIMMADIIVKSEEENIPLVSGRYPTKEELESGKHIIILGRKNAQHAYKRNGTSYYMLQGEEYQVIGVAGAGKSVIYDDIIMLYMDCLGEKTKEKLNDAFFSGYDMVIQSNKENSIDIYRAFVENKYFVELENEELNIRMNTAALDREGLYCVIIYLFCFICLTISMKLYIMQRSKEMQICKAYGFSNIRIIGRITKSLISISFVSFVIFMGTVVIFNYKMGDFAEEYRLGFSWDIICPYVGIFVLAIVLAGAMPVNQLLHKSVVQSMNDRR